MDEQKYKEQIYKKASEVKNEMQLAALLREISDFKHDYGTIVYGCMAAMKAAFNVVNNGPQGGITGFQAGCLGWECIHSFMSVEAPCRILDYNNLLYPQYAEKFQPTISKDVFEDIQKKALELLMVERQAAPTVIEHWKSIAMGEVPFGLTIKAEE